MGQRINQKSHDSAIFNIIVLLTKEHHTLLKHNGITQKIEKENHLFQREKISQKQKNENTQ